MFFDNANIKVTGHVTITDITDPDNEIVLVDDHNDIHPESMSYAIAMAMSATVDITGKSTGAISEMRFGNGGTVVLSSGRVTFKKPRTTSFGGLYSETFRKQINPNVNSSVEKEYNNVVPVHIPGQVFSDTVCTCTLGLGEPIDQNVSSSTDMEGKYVFDELALYTNGDTGRALTHLIFTPVEKSANRVLQIKYTIRFQLQ